MLRIKRTEYTSLYDDQNYKEILKSLKKINGRFRDEHFPLDDKYKWMRPREILRTKPQFMVNGFTKFDVNQGNLDDCWFLAAAASLALRQDLLDIVIPKQTSFKYGIFRFRFYRWGKWVEVVIDDYLPVIEKNGENVRQFTESGDSTEFWIGLLEKAYAKLKGFTNIADDTTRLKNPYGNIYGGFSRMALTDMTGGYAETYRLKDEEHLPDDLYLRILDANDQKAPMTAGINEGVGGCGLAASHAYSITGAAIVNVTQGDTSYQTRLIRVRNPHGRRTDFEWEGKWSDESEAWKNIPENKRSELLKVNLTDGEFWMSYTDFLTYFDLLDICFVPNKGNARIKEQCQKLKMWQDNNRDIPIDVQEDILTTISVIPQKLKLPNDPCSNLLIQAENWGIDQIDTIRKRLKRVWPFRRPRSDQVTVMIEMLTNMENRNEALLISFRIFQDDDVVGRADVCPDGYLRDVSGRFTLEPGSYTIKAELKKRAPCDSFPIPEKFIIRIFTDTYTFVYR